MHRSRSIRLRPCWGGCRLALAGCADSDREDPAASGDGGEQQREGGTFVFAASSDPVSLDPAFAATASRSASPGRSSRASSARARTADPAPLLATEWETSDDG
jgi:peptide/nickel transport system substrate-binding protein